MFSEQYFSNTLNHKTRPNCLKLFRSCCAHCINVILSVLVNHENVNRFPNETVPPTFVVIQHPIISLSLHHFRLPFTFVTKEVAEATCNCLLAQAEQADKKGKSKAAAERMILEEFGRCLMSVINSAGKAKSDPCAMNC